MGTVSSRTQVKNHSVRWSDRQEFLAQRFRIMPTGSRTRSNSDSYTWGRGPIPSYRRSDFISPSVAAYPSDIFDVLLLVFLNVQYMHSCTSKYLPTLLLRSLWSVFRVPNHFRLVEFRQFVSEWHSATVRVTSAVLDCGDRCESLVAN